MGLCRTRGVAETMHYPNLHAGCVEPSKHCKSELAAATFFATAGLPRFRRLAYNWLRVPKNCLLNRWSILYLYAFCNLGIIRAHEGFV